MATGFAAHVACRDPKGLYLFRRKTHELEGSDRCQSPESGKESLYVLFPGIRELDKLVVSPDLYLPRPSTKEHLLYWCALACRGALFH